MSDFSKLVTKLITPALLARGFRKHGHTEPYPLHGFASYRRDDLEVRLTQAFHPYDFPEIGIRLEVLRDGAQLVNQLFPPVDGGIEAILRNILKDIESGAAVAEAFATPDSARNIDSGSS